MPALHALHSPQAKVEKNMTTPDLYDPAQRWVDTIDLLIGEGGLIDDARHLVETGKSSECHHFKIESQLERDRLTLTITQQPPLLQRVREVFQTHGSARPSLVITAHADGILSLRCRVEDSLQLTKSLPSSSAAKLLAAKTVLADNIFDWIAHYSPTHPAFAPNSGLRHAHFG